jgi:hypothetical protein
LTCLLEAQLGSVHGEACPYRHDAEYYLKHEHEEDQLVPMMLAQVFPLDLMDLLETVRPLSLIRQRWEIVLQYLHSLNSTTGRPILVCKIPAQLVDFANKVQPVEHVDALSFAARILREEGNGGSETSLENDQREKIALSLVLHGWMPICTEPEFLQCSICWSRVCLSPCGYNSTTNLPTTAPPSKRARSNGPSCPLEGHRHYCPFFCGFPCKNATTMTPLWESLCKRLFQQIEAEAAKECNSVPRISGVSRIEIRRILLSGVSSMRPPEKPKAT